MPSISSEESPVHVPIISVLGAEDDTQQGGTGTSGKVDDLGQGVLSSSDLQAFFEKEVTLDDVQAEKVGTGTATGVRLRTASLGRRVLDSLGLGRERRGRAGSAPGGRRLSLVPKGIARTRQRRHSSASLKKQFPGINRFIKASVKVIGEEGEMVKIDKASLKDLEKLQDSELLLEVLSRQENVVVDGKSEGRYVGEVLAADPFGSAAFFYELVSKHYDAFEKLPEEVRGAALCGGVICLFYGAEAELEGELPRILEALCDKKLEVANSDDEASTACYDTACELISEMSSSRVHAKLMRSIDHDGQRLRDLRGTLSDIVYSMTSPKAEE